MARRFALFLVVALTSTTAWAQAVPAPAPPPAPDNSSEPMRFFTRLSNLFGVDLPELDRPNAIKLTLRPHVGDLVHRDYLRTEAGLKWALNDHFELRSDASVFFTHGLGDSAGYGVGMLRGGAKYVFSDWPKRDYETSLDVNLSAPVGHAPIDMSDGFYHLRPSFAVQHLSYHNPRLTVFGGMGLDLVKKSTIPGTPGFNQPRDNSVFVSGGGIYDLGQIKWTFTATYATTTWIGERSQQFAYVQPGMLWYVPRRFTFNSKSQYIVGLGVRGTWGPDGTDLSVTSRLRVEFTFRQLMDGIRRHVPKP